ncbi:MAG: TonB-dependent receptor [Flavobacteriales bacterium]
MAQDCLFSCVFNFLEEGTENQITNVQLIHQKPSYSDWKRKNSTDTLNSLCAGEHRFIIDVLGYKADTFKVQLDQDTLITYYLKPAKHLLEEASVISALDNESTSEQSFLTTTQIKETPHLDLGSVLENTPGVSTIRNGSSGSKPIIHGLYGQRITLINHGLAQAGQLWGLDHSPEIDPFTSGGINLIKGTAALEYPGSSLGGIIVTKDHIILRDSVLHGGIRGLAESNGRAGGTSLTLQRGTDKMSWRAYGSVHKSGDRHAPDYLLKNTGGLRYSGAIQLEFRHSEKWETKTYVSTFSQEIGILRGAHVGNLTDLEAALGREIPFFTTDTFSYAYNAPYQSVQHFLGRVSSTYQWKKKHTIQLLYGFQWNQRKEYDVRRGGRSSKPALSLDQSNHFLEFKHRFQISDYITLKSGVQLNRTDNVNVPETGILPLIPDYISNKVGAYTLLRRKKANQQFSLGIRADMEDRNVAAISATLPREILRFNDVYRNFSASLGWQRIIKDRWNLKLNAGAANRNPEVNELYSNGLHQGASGIEQGNLNLNPEFSFKQTVSVSGDISKKFWLEALVYHQYFSDFIYLAPTDEVSLTIRGAFPVFDYEQVDSRIYGADFTAVFTLSNEMSTRFSYSHLVGENLDINVPLVFMPQNNLGAAWSWKKELNTVKDIKIDLGYRYHFEQFRLNENQDFLAPPNGYGLINASVSMTQHWKKNSLTVLLRVDNLMNTRYRDYMNRQRYFTDDLGRNIVFGVNLEF